MASKNDRNPGIPLDLDWVAGATVNRSAVERRTASLPKRRSVKKEWQAAWLLRAVTCIDLTTLSGDDTPGQTKVKEKLRQLRDWAQIEFEGTDHSGYRYWVTR